MYPKIFFQHDIFHIRKELVDDPPQFLFYFQQKLANLPRYERKALERVYFQLTHEIKDSLIEGTYPDALEHLKLSLIGSLNFFSLLTFIPGIMMIYETGQFSRLISEVNQELALLHNK